MQKIVYLLFLLFFVSTEVYAYAIKVYDEYGNRIGTYRKEGENYELYDFYDKKIKNPKELINNAPSQKTLTEFSQTLYDENMNPVGTWRSGYYGNNGRYYPRYGYYYPSSWFKSNYPYIVRPHIKNNFSNNQFVIKNSTNIINSSSGISIRPHRKIH